MHTEIGPGVIQIDTLLGGWERVTAGYLIEGSAPVLVETGSQTSVHVLLEGLADLNVAPADLAGIVVTHIHLDHAGGVGDVARTFPAAEVVVQERGARHLVDPSKLMASARRVFGTAVDDVFGPLRPTEETRVRAIGDAGTVDLG